MYGCLFVYVCQHFKVKNLKELKSFFFSNINYYVLFFPSNTIQLCLLNFFFFWILLFVFVIIWHHKRYISAGGAQHRCARHFTDCIDVKFYVFSVELPTHGESPRFPFIRYTLSHNRWLCCGVANQIFLNTYAINNAYLMCCATDLCVYVCLYV